MPAVVAWAGLTAGTLQGGRPLPAHSRASLHVIALQADALLGQDLGLDPPQLRVVSDTPSLALSVKSSRRGGCKLCQTGLAAPGETLAT